MDASGWWSGGGGGGEADGTLEPGRGRALQEGPPSPQAPSSFLFSPSLPCKDNQVYVKCVCSFDSPRYLINSITPNSFVPKVLKCDRDPAFLVLSITVNIFLQLPWLGPEFMKTENESQQNKNKDLFEILFLKDI